MSSRDGPDEPTIFTSIETLETQKLTPEQLRRKAYEFGTEINIRAIENANSVLRTILLINGGAAVSLLAFIGNLAGNHVIDGTVILGFSIPLLWFCGGLVSTIMSMAAAYLTNYFVAAHAFAVANGETRSELRLGWLKIFAHYTAAAFAAVSVAFFVAGVISVRSAIEGLYQG